jgi:hypothetical protein
MAAMVFIIEILVITLAGMMFAPIGVPLFKSPPVMRMLLIPRMPMGRVPDLGPDNIGGRVSVIRGPAILIAEILVQQSI